MILTWEFQSQDFSCHRNVYTATENKTKMVFFFIEYAFFKYFLGLKD